MDNAGPPYCYRCQQIEPCDCGEHLNAEQYIHVLLTEGGELKEKLRLIEEFVEHKYQTRTAKETRDFIKTTVSGKQS